MIIKARFLSAEDFAYIAVIMILIGFFQTIENFGISQAIIRRETIDSRETSSLFFLNILIALSCGIIIYLSSSIIANMFSLPELEYYVKIISLLLIIGGPAHLFRAFLEKNLLFKELSLIEIAGNFIMFGVVSALLFAGLGVLGVIYGYLAAGIFSASAITFVCIKNKLCRIILFFNFKRTVPFIKFGAFAFGREITNYFTYRADEIIIGLFLSPEILGFYYFGKNMLERIRQIISSTYGKILYPALAKLKKDQERFSKAYLVISKYIAFVTFPVFSGIALTAHLFVPLIFGAQWNESIIVFQVFSFALIFNFFSAGLAISVFYSLDKPEDAFYIDLFSSIIYISALFLFARHGIVFVLFISLLHRFLKALVFQSYAIKNLSTTLREWFTMSIKTPALLSAVMLFFVFIFQWLTDDYLGLIAQLSISIVLGSAIYILLMYYFEKEALISLKGFLTKKPVI
jgi:O-antigen/teichoic acid export membrane protein